MMGLEGLGSKNRHRPYRAAALRTRRQAEHPAMSRVMDTFS